MRTTRLGAVLASLAITTGAAALLAEAPAHADTPAAATATTSTLTIDDGRHQAKGQYGDVVGFLEGSITDQAGNPVDGGPVELQARRPGQSWTVAKSFADANSLAIADYGSKAKGNVAYRLHYLGDATYAPSYSEVVTVTTLWNFKDTSACSRGHCHISGRLIPRTKHHQILVQVKHGSWKRYRVLHTGSKGTYRVGVVGSRGHGTKYRIIIAGTKSIVTTARAYRVVRL